MQLHWRSGFVAKALAAAALVALGDLLFWQDGGLGSRLGIFALAWTFATLALVPAIRRSRAALAAITAAAILGGVLLHDPGLLAVWMFLVALSCAALLPRHSGFDHAGRWAVRLIVHGAASTIGPWADLFRLRRHATPGTVRPRSLVSLLALPLLGGAVFLTLFAAANPLILQWFERLAGPRFDPNLLGHALFWAFLLTLVWSSLRPRRFGLPFPAIEPGTPLPLPGVSIASVTLALATFNALFALQNGLDLAFLWSGALLPQGMTLAEYAHRGAYPLILTALLAGAFVLVALRPGSATAAAPAIRLLVALWIAQNVFLVASTVLRTIDYIEVYSLTGLRIAAMLWMALVAIGLVLILWRMLTGRSAAWLINANALAAALVLLACTIVDIGAVAAAWNVRHARDVGGRGADLDLCYLAELGPSALVPLVELELRKPLPPELGQRVAWVRHGVLIETIERQQSGWWTWRGARRLGQIETMLAGRKLAAPPSRGQYGRRCDGRFNPSPLETVEPPPVATSETPANTTEPPLTNETVR